MSPATYVASNLRWWHWGFVVAVLIVIVPMLGCGESSSEESAAHAGFAEPREPNSGLSQAEYEREEAESQAQEAEEFKEEQEDAAQQAEEEREEAERRAEEEQQQAEYEREEAEEQREEAESGYGYGY